MNLRFNDIENLKIKRIVSNLKKKYNTLLRDSCLKLFKMNVRLYMINKKLLNFLDST